MPRGKKASKGKEKAAASLKRPPSTHDLRKESSTGGDITGPGASSKFSAVINFSSEASAVDPPVGEIPAITGSVTELEGTDERPATTPMTPRRRAGSSLMRIRIETGESSKGLESSLSWNGVGSQKSLSTPPTPSILRTPSSALATQSASISDGSPLRSLFSKWNGVASPIASLGSPTASVESPMTRSPTRLVDSTPSRTAMGKCAKSQKRNRSISQFPGVLRDMAESAGNRVEYVTLFEEPFPDPQRAEEILDKVWRQTERDYQNDHARDNKIDAYLRSVQSRTRSHLVSDAKKNIAFLYQFDRNTSKEYIRDHVGRLLKRDRFTCAESVRKSCSYRFRAQEGVDLIYYHYFNGKKKLGNVDSGFIKNISGPFMCLIFTALYHALSAWESGECEMTTEFSYINCSDVYKRLLDQWRLYPTSVQEMIIKVTQSEIVKKGQHSGKKVRWQQDTAYEVDSEEVEEFARQLAADLRSAGLNSSEGGRDADDSGSTTEEDTWEGNEPTYIEEEEDGSGGEENNAENDSGTEEGGISGVEENEMSGAEDNE